VLYSGRVKIRVRIRFSVWLVRCYAHVFVVCVLIVAHPNDKSKIINNNNYKT